MAAPLVCCTWQGFVKKIKNWCKAGPELRRGVMVEAAKGFKLHPTSILYACNMFQHLDMMWMDV
jgi:hypothetical protein